MLKGLLREACELGYCRVGGEVVHTASGSIVMPIVSFAYRAGGNTPMSAEWLRFTRDDGNHLWLAERLSELLPSRSPELARAFPLRYERSWRK